MPQVEEKEAVMRGRSARVRWGWIPTLGCLLFFTWVAHAEYQAQPTGWSSSLGVHSGAAVYDWQLSNMISRWLVPRGFANMVFVFDECYGGGMIDNLDAVLRGRGDAALVSAARHDELAWSLDASIFTRARNALASLGFDRPTSLFGKEVTEEMARIGSAARTMSQIASDAEAADLVREGGRHPDGRPWGDYKPGVPIVEHPQWHEIGNGGAVKLGRKASGEEVASRHAILFAGKANRIADWNEIDHLYMVLIQYNGYAPENVHVLIGGGPGSTHPDGTPAPAYVDGAGTKAALWNAIRTVGRQMNESEQFLFWGSDHGDRQRIGRPLTQNVEVPARTAIPRSATSDTGATSRELETWDLDETFLHDILAVPDNAPFVSVILDGEAVPDWTIDDLGLFVNDVPSACDLIEPITTLNLDLDVDGYEFRFPVDESVLGLENTLELIWTGEETGFAPYTVRTVQISTGAIAVSPPPLEDEEEEDMTVVPPELTPTVGFGAWSVAAGTQLEIPGWNTDLWLDVSLEAGPFVLRSETDIQVLPNFFGAERLETGFDWGWLSILGSAVADLGAMSVIAIGASIDLGVYDATLLDEPFRLTFDGWGGWGPTWTPLWTFSHAVWGLLHLDAEGTVVLPWEIPLILRANVTAGATFDLLSGAFTPSLSAGSSAEVLLAGTEDDFAFTATIRATTDVLPFFTGDVDLELRLESAGWAFYTQLSLGGVVIGAEMTLGGEF